MSGLRNYLVVTLGYWAFTLTDGAIRMLVVLYFHQLGYSPLEIAMLFLFYEFFGVVTNLVGGWIGSRIGLNRTMQIGMAMQVVALVMLAVPAAWLSVPYVMGAQALSGIAKDLNKMSAKASVKLMVPKGGEDARLFKWVSILTGSKNALKGGGFFLGALLLATVGFQMALLWLAGMLLLVLGVVWLLPTELGVSQSKPKFSQLFSRSEAINWLSAARFFLFGSRDIWFVVALPIFLASTMEWGHLQVGSFLAFWVVGYGVVQSLVPLLLRHFSIHPGAGTAQAVALLLALIPAGIASGLMTGFNPAWVVVAGLAIFGVVFAINSALHSYLILAYSDYDKVAANVGFYYMANAGGRLMGTVLSGWVYQQQGLQGCLWWSAAMVLLALLFSLRLPR